jgi:hypothetical protein
MAQKFGFHRGWSGSPAHTGYDANSGMDAPAGSEAGPRIGPGYLAKVEMEVAKGARGMGRGKRGGYSNGGED